MIETITVTCRTCGAQTEQVEPLQVLLEASVAIAKLKNLKAWLRMRADDCLTKVDVASKRGQVAAAGHWRDAAHHYEMALRELESEKPRG